MEQKPITGKKLTEEALNKQFSLKFSRRQLLILWNLMMRGQYSLPDAKVLIDITALIDSPVNTLTESDFEPETETGVPVLN